MQNADLDVGYFPQAYSIYGTYSALYHPYIAPLFRFILATQAAFYRYVFPVLYPLHALANNALQSFSSDSPDVVTLLLLGVVLLVSLRVLDYIRRTLMFWINIAIRIGTFVLLAASVVYVWQRGVEQSLEDFGWLWGLIEGLGDEGQRMGDRRAKGREREAQRAKYASTGRRGRTRGAGW